MKVRRTVALVVASCLILVVVGCGASERTTTSATSATTVPQTPVTADEYDVYSALIQSVYIDAAQPKQIVIIGSTVNPHQDIQRAAPAMKSSWPDLDDDILGDFKAKNRTSSALQRAFTLSVPYTLIGDQELASSFPPTGPGWENFYAKYPGAKGRLTLSRVGFNQAKDTAVLYTEYGRHAAVGEGEVVLMKKTDGRWTVEENSMFWAS